MVNLQDLYPGNLADLPPDRVAREMMGLFLVRTHMVTGGRFALGWRGLKQTGGRVGGGGWTARISGCPGVFGLAFHHPVDEVGWRGGVFRLSYFPTPNEDLLENVSLAAAAVVHREDYPTLVRGFTAYPELADLFVIGRVHLLIHPACGAVTLGLAAPSRDRILAPEGIQVPVDGKVAFLVAPGGADRDFPAFTVSYALFETLAASVTFNLKAPPSLLAHIDGPGTEGFYKQAGAVQYQPAVDSRALSLLLGYGNAAGPAFAAWPFGQQTASGHAIRREAVAASQLFPQALWRVAHRTRDIQNIDKQALGIDERPSLIVLTGFLGAGKTSFLRNFIEYQVQMSRFVAVIQNEIGAVGLDGKLMEEDVAVTEMDEGCVCCSLIGNLKIAIGRILSVFQPDVIVLETTGLANPFNLLDDLRELSEHVRFDSVTTVMDAGQAIAALERHGVVRDQVRAADILLVNKVDLVSEAALRSLKDRLGALNPRAAILTASHGSIAPGLLYGTDPLEEAPGASGRQGFMAGPRPTHDQEGIQSIKIAFDTPLDRGRFIQAIEEKMPLTMLRIKGILEFSGQATPWVFQYVGGRYDLSPFSNRRATERFLIFIGRDMDPDQIQAAVGGRLGDHDHGPG